MTAPENKPDPILGVLPGVVLFIAIGVLMLLLLADTPEVESEGQAAEVSVAATTEEGAAIEEAAATEEAVATEEAAATEETVVEDAGDGELNYDPALVSAGETQYLTTCIACHGFDARGIPGLGKDLLMSEFMDGLDEEGFIEFVNVGRDITDPLNTTGVMMPAKGGNPILTDDDIAAIWAYLRSHAIPAEGSTGDEPAATEESVATEEAAATEEAEAATTTSGELNYDPALISTGETQFMTTCIACHGFDARGIPGLGKDLLVSEFMDGLDEEGFIEFVNVGRDITDPLNTTGVMMPAKGGNPILTDDDIAAIWAYLRSKAETVE